MMYPILCKVRFESLHRVFSARKIWIQIGFSVVANWLIAPFLMVCTVLLIQIRNAHLSKLGLAFAFLPDQSDLRQGLILVGVARCIAMVRSVFFDICKWLLIQSRSSFGTAWLVGMLNTVLYSLPSTPSFN